MSIEKEAKLNLVKNFAQKEKDTGSPEVQCALFTQHIRNLTDHLKGNKKDYSAIRGLLAHVVKRKRLLIYLKKRNLIRYEKLIKELKIKGI
ncbi:MAG: small subunit ribosomal protein S15 [Candidatus Midichloriaceae bacterium]|jgi:small subunit ribosomal protein S15